MSGEFTESLALPREIDAGKADGRNEAGILMITVPKAEHAKPKSIKIQTAR